MISLIFGLFIIIGIVFSIFSGNIGNMSNVIVKSASDTFNIITGLFPLMALWLGIMNIASKSGFLKKLTHLLRPILNLLFPDVPKDSKALEYVSSNIIMNMFGLGNAATPMGIKALKSLKELNNNSDTASDSMITFLVLNTTGFTIIPTTIISYRLMYGSANPSAITPICIIASLLGSIVGILINLVLKKVFRWHS